MFAVHDPADQQTLLPGIGMRTLCYGARTLMTEFQLAGGSSLPRHAHPYEQTGYLVSGHLVLAIGDETHEVRPGDSWCIPGSVEHGAEVLQDSVALEVFSPVREDYLPAKARGGGDGARTTAQVRLLGHGDGPLLAKVAPGVFDYPVDDRLAQEVLTDPRHHLAVALDGDTVVGFASAVHYVHPDKPPELWVNEVSVAETHRRHGLAKALLRALFEAGRGLGCAHAWVLTDRENRAAMRLYASAGGIGTEHMMFTFRLGAGPPP